MVTHWLSTTCAGMFGGPMVPGRDPVQRRNSAVGTVIGTSVNSGPHGAKVVWRYGSSARDGAAVTPTQPITIASTTAPAINPRVALPSMPRMPALSSHPGQGILRDAGAGLNRPIGRFRGRRPVPRPSAGG